jgi:hypothetical protein
MTSFWKENQFVSTNKKKSLKENSWFGVPKCKLGSKVAQKLFLKHEKKKKKKKEERLNQRLT